MHREASSHFQDATVLHKAHDAIYSGNNLNLNCIVNSATEVTQRIQDTKRTWKKANLYWKKSSAGKTWQLIIYDAVFRSKLLLNLETMYLTQSPGNKLDTVHIRGLKKIFQVPRTYSNRRYTHARVHELASQTAHPNYLKRSVRPFFAISDEKQVRLARHILQAANTNPLRHVVYGLTTATTNRIGKRQVGRPRINWVHNTHELIHSRGNATEDVASLDQNKARCPSVSPSLTPARDAW